MEEKQKKVLIEALTQVALSESKEISVGFAEIIAYLQKQEHLAARGTLIALESHLEFASMLLKTAAYITQI